MVQVYLVPVFRIPVFFFKSESSFFFLSPDPYWPKIRIRSDIMIKIHEKKRSKTFRTGRTFFISYLALSTLSFLFRFLQNLIKAII